MGAGLVAAAAGAGLAAGGASFFGGAGGARGGSRSSGPEATFSEGADRWDYTSPGGSFPPNGFGLFDMVGNVWQMTQDCWSATYVGAPADANAWMAGDCTAHVLRGGSWFKPPAGERSAMA